MTRYVQWAVGLGAIAGLVAMAPADVIISEIMYNPDSDESQPNDVEWLEIYNTGSDPVDITGWYLQDEDGQTDGVASPTMISPGQAIILAPSPMTVDEFHDAWGDGYEVLIIANWAFPDGITGLSNSPSDVNEILTLRDGGGAIVDEVNYDDEGDWPTDNPDGFSINLLPDKLDPVSNDSGLNWRLSEIDVAGGRLVNPTLAFMGIDIGSPGFVETSSGGCYPDCDASGTLDFFDFLCFQNAFAAGDPYADCDGTGALDFFDFLCFQNEFAAGCP